MKGEDLIGELLKSLYETRKTAQNWEKKWQRVIIDSDFFDWYMVTPMRTSSCVSCVGFVLDEGLILKRRAVLGPDDGDDKTVTILNRLVTCVCLSGSRNQIELEADPRAPSRSCLRR